MDSRAKLQEAAELIQDVLDSGEFGLDPDAMTALSEARESTHKALECVRGLLGSGEPPKVER